MKINELFHSIQGEGIYAGVPMSFIRLQGCNLRCSWCDTEYAQDGSGGVEMTARQIEDSLMKYRPRPDWVCITGGEPLMHANLVELVDRLRRSYNITIETNGSFPYPKWSFLVSSWSVDIKCPSSGWCGSSRVDEWNREARDQLKFVVQTEEDLEFVSKVVSSNDLVPIVLVSPVLGFSSPLDSVLSPVFGPNKGEAWLQRVADFCKEHNLRMSLQLHKVIWGNKIGV